MVLTGALRRKQCSSCPAPCTAALHKLQRFLSLRAVLHGSSHFAAKTDASHSPSRSTDLVPDIAQQGLKGSDASQHAYVLGLGMRTLPV